MATVMKLLDPNSSPASIAVDITRGTAHTVSRRAPADLQILRKGELQVNNLERSHQLAALSREIATLVAEMTVDPATGRKHTVGMVEKAMTELGYSTRADKAAKSQALDLIKTLSQPGSVLPLERVRMRVRITMPSKDAKRIKDKVVALVDEVEEEEMDAEWETVSTSCVLRIRFHIS